MTSGMAFALRSRTTRSHKIKPLRLGPGHRVGVVFANKDGADQGKQYTCWLTLSLADVRVQVEQ